LKNIKDISCFAKNLGP